jgi:hypothetical protein
VGFPEGTARLDGGFVAPLFAPMPDIDKDRPIQPGWLSKSGQASVSAYRCCCPLFVSLDAARFRIRTIFITPPHLWHRIATRDSPQAPASDKDNIYCLRAIVIQSHFPTPAPNKAFQPFLPGKAHETVGVLDDNLGAMLCAAVNPLTGLAMAFGR